MFLGWSARAACVTLGALGLFAVGVWHVLDGAATERMFRDATRVRYVGALLLLVTVPCLVWRGWFFSGMGAILGASGALRLFAPERNIRLQKAAYPRWVHGWVMITGAVLLWCVYMRWGE